MILFSAATPLVAMFSGLVAMVAAVGKKLIGELVVRIRGPSWDQVADEILEEEYQAESEVVPLPLPIIPDEVQHPVRRRSLRVLTSYDADEGGWTVHPRVVADAVDANPRWNGVAYGVPVEQDVDLDALMQNHPLPWSSSLVGEA